HRALVAKVYRPGAWSEDALRGEFALLARVAAPGLVRAHDLGRDDQTGAPFLVEDFVDGDEVTAWIAAAEPHARSGRLVRVLGEVAQTLAALHDAAFVHADLKPAHVRIPKNGGRAVVLDLGAAVGQRSGLAVHAFTPAFAAPEVAAGQPPSP